MTPRLANLRHVGLRPYAKTLWSAWRFRLGDLFWRTETISAEMTVGLASAGCWLILTSDDVFAFGHLYVYLARLASQDWWGYGLGLLGTWHVGASILLPSSRWRCVRAAAWFLSCAVWTYIAWVSVLAVPVTTAAAMHWVLALSCAWGFIRSVGPDA